MKSFGTVALIAGLLFAAALFYRAQHQGSEEVSQPSDARASILPGALLPNSSSTPKISDRARGLLTLKADSSQGYVLNEMAEEVFASVDISAKSEQSAPRPPLNIALVIDRSGSMKGEKMAYARDASLALVDQLGPQDRLALVSYATDVSVLSESQRASEEVKEGMREAIKGLKAAGGTNISGGYVEAFKQVRDHVDERSISRVILVSDGEANIGLTNPKALKNLAADYSRRGVSLSTIGVGLDYNEDVMAGMADEGAGNYYFVDDALSAVRVFQTEMERLGGTVAKNTELVITLGEGVEHAQLYGYMYQREGQTLRVALHEFRGGDNKNLLLKLNVKPGARGKSALLRADLRYQRIDTSQKDSNQVELSVVRTDDAGELMGERNLEVIERVQQVEIAQRIASAMDAYRAGRDEEARQELDRTQERVEDTKRRYQLDTEGLDAARERLEASIKEVQKPAPEAARVRAAKRFKESSRNMQKAAVIELW